MSAVRRGVSLKDALAKSVAEDAAAEAQPAASPPPAPAAPPKRLEREAVGLANVKIECFLTEADRDRLKRIALDEKRSLQQIQHEALSTWLRANGHEALTPSTASRPSGRKMR